MNSHYNNKAFEHLRKAAMEMLLIPYRWLFTYMIALRGNIVEIEGCKFAVGSPAINRKNRFLFNHYEASERDAIRRYLDPKLPVIELGSALGVISCLVNRRLEAPEQHVAIEANPDLIPVLQENRELNGCGFTVLHRAIAYDGPEAAFYVSNNFTESSTRGTSAQPVFVLTTTLTTVANHYGFDRFTLLCDIEGTEKDLIVNEAKVLRERVETLFIEIHESLGERVRNELIDDVLKLDFQQVFHVDDDYVFRKSNRG